MLTFTLDTNCIIAVEEERAEAPAVRKLSAAHATGTARVAVVAISASERQREGGRLHSFFTFEERLARLDLAHLELLFPMAYLDVAYLDRCVLADDAMLDLERRIHEVLFPTIEFAWTDYCHARGLKPDELPADHKWINAKCDVQALWSHIHYGREVFVTSDANFHSTGNRPKLIALGANSIARPDDAAGLV